MARKKNEMKRRDARKAPVQETVSTLSIYLDIYYKGKRYYEFLKLYTSPGTFP